MNLSHTGREQQKKDTNDGGLEKKHAIIVFRREEIRRIYLCINKGQWK